MDLYWNVSVKIPSHVSWLHDSEEITDVWDSIEEVVICFSWYWVVHWQTPLDLFYKFVSFKISQDLILLFLTLRNPFSCSDKIVHILHLAFDCYATSVLNLIILLIVVLNIIESQRFYTTYALFWTWASCLKILRPGSFRASSAMDRIHLLHI